jgi:hypothetical protein
MTASLPDLSIPESDDIQVDKPQKAYQEKSQQTSSQYAGRDEITLNLTDWIQDIERDGCCPKFSQAELLVISAIIEKHKAIPIPEYAPSAYMEHVKKVCWIVPLAYTGSPMPLGSSSTKTGSMALMTMTTRSG